MKRAVWRWEQQLTVIVFFRGSESPSLDSFRFPSLPISEETIFAGGEDDKGAREGEGKACCRRGLCNVYGGCCLPLAQEHKSTGAGWNLEGARQPRPHY